MNWNTVWDIIKVVIIPVAIWYFEKQVAIRDDRREREYRERKNQMDEAQKRNTDLQFLMLERIDNLSETTHLMAKKLHDAGIINGDLEELDDKYKGLDAKYHDSIKRLALEVLNK